MKKKSKQELKLLLVIISVSILNFCLLVAVLFRQDKVHFKDDSKDTQVVIPKKDDNFVFLGDSITDWYPFDSLYEDDVPIINSGIAGYKTADILKKMDELVYRYNPTKVFILIGTNDLNCDDSNSEIALKNIKKIIKGIKTNRPSAEIYLQSIYPVNQTDDKKIVHSSTGKRTNEEIQKLNIELQKYAISEDITYINMYSELLDDEGNLALKYTHDGLHLSDLGYLKVTQKLLSYMKE